MQLRVLLYGFGSRRTGRRGGGAGGAPPPLTAVVQTGIVGAPSTPQSGGIGERCRSHVTGRH